MRWKLARADEIYVVNLHGNAKKKESAPDGSKDENVFNIMQGVSINIFVKKGNSASDLQRGHGCKSIAESLAAVRYCDLYGKRGEKFAWLESKPLESVRWKTVAPQAPMYFFVPKDANGIDEFNAGFSLQDIFCESSVGIVTANDKALVAESCDALRDQISQFYGEVPDDGMIHKVAYRPFDERYLYYDVNKIERPREKTMRQLLTDDNLVLLSVRQLAGTEWCHVSVADKIVDDCRVSNRSKERGYVFPLYLYEENFGKAEKRPNFNVEICDKIAAALKRKLSPDIMGTGFLKVVPATETATVL